MSPASTVGIRTLPTSANRMEILAIPTPTTDPQATTTGTAETEIKTTHSNSSNESCPDSSGISAPSFAQQGRRNFGGQTQPHSEAICHACGEMGHVHPDCDKDILRDRWFINRAFVAVQNIGPDAPPSHITATLDNASTSSQRSQRSSTPASNRRSDRPNDLSWQGLQFFNTVDEPCKPQSVFGFSQAPPPARLSNVFLPDSGSGIDGTVCNPCLIRNICPAKRPTAMHTNAVACTLTLEAEVPAFGKVCCDPDHIANIFGLANVVDTADCVTFDSQIDDAFHVGKDNRETIFARTPANLCAHKPTA